ncbi:hypothetical protein MOB1_18600 [Faecalimonas mobilis]
MFFAGMALGAMTGAAFGIGLMCCVVAGKREDQQMEQMRIRRQNRENQNRSSSEIWKGQSGSPFWMGKVFA